MEFFYLKTLNTKPNLQTSYTQQVNIINTTDHSFDTAEKNG